MSNLNSTWLLPDKSLTTAWHPTDNCLITTSWLPDNNLMTTWQLPDVCLTIARQMFYDCVTWPLNHTKVSFAQNDFNKTRWRQKLLAYEAACSMSTLNISNGENLLKMVKMVWLTSSFLPNLMNFVIFGLNKLKVPIYLRNSVHKILKSNLLQMWFCWPLKFCLFHHLEVHMFGRHRKLMV